MEHEAEYAKLLTRHSDYDELLRSGFVIVQSDDPDSWRKNLKAEARADKIRVRTGIADADDQVVWAYLKRLDEHPLSDDELDERYRHIDAVQEAMARSRFRGHSIRSLIRSEGNRAAAFCESCGARLYLDTSYDPPLMDGEVF
jgi:hypothetical protein